VSKYSVRIYNDSEVRAIWDEQNTKWWFNAVDICKVLSQSTNPSTYWRVLKARLKRGDNQTVTICNAFKFTAPDGKKRSMDALDSEGILKLASVFPNYKKANQFLEWFTYGDNSIDGQSKKKAYTLFDSSLIDEIEVGTTKGLQQIHAFLFGGLYDHAGKIRSQNIAKGGFQFAMVRYLTDTLSTIDKMPDTTFDQIVDKYTELNVAHPFMEGNGRSTRIWLDILLKKRLQKCINWSKITKRDYLNAMVASPVDNNAIRHLLQNALTDKIYDREMYLKGIDYSYYYEEPE